MLGQAKEAEEIMVYGMLVPVPIISSTYFACSIAVIFLYLHNGYEMETVKIEDDGQFCGSPLSFPEKRRPRMGGAIFLYL